MTLPAAKEISQLYLYGANSAPVDLVDASASPEGSPSNCMNLDIQSAQRLRQQLERCIDVSLR
jgi:hypothetical protein